MWHHRAALVRERADSGEGCGEGEGAGWEVDEQQVRDLFDKEKNPRIQKAKGEDGREVRRICARRRGDGPDGGGAAPSVSAVKEMTVPRRQLMVWRDDLPQPEFLRRATGVCVRVTTGAGVRGPQGTYAIGLTPQEVAPGLLALPLFARAHAAWKERRPDPPPPPPQQQQQQGTAPTEAAAARVEAEGQQPAGAPERHRDRAERGGGAGAAAGVLQVGSRVAQANSLRPGEVAEVVGAYEDDVARWVRLRNPRGELSPESFDALEFIPVDAAGGGVGHDKPAPRGQPAGSLLGDKGLQEIAEGCASREWGRRKLRDAVVAVAALLRVAAPSAAGAHGGGTLRKLRELCAQAEQRGADMVKRANEVPSSCTDASRESSKPGAAVRLSKRRFAAVEWRSECDEHWDRDRKWY
eukprot:gene1388-60328_t